MKTTSSAGRPARALILAAVLAVVTGVAAGDSREWKPVTGDGLHDPDNPAAAVLQSPAEALKRLPPDTAGNQVNWVKALRDGYVKPRTTLDATTPVQTLDADILMKRTVEMPYVRFPHLAHTEWLECGNCHEKIFKSKAGATPISMFAILQGEYCGRCHGAVAFPLTECNRCHSVPHKAVKDKP